ncbi:site-specific DNA-methyltransferase, partial [Candidatus Aerophobetes bacterium]|nr:site-specific DNA-methyltransferase [Candidatus Aerophobetes bacterium]
DERLVSEGEILKNKVIELALKLDKGLIKLLLSDEKMKEVFFVEVDGTLIFDKDKFVKFVSNKQFLLDSYTAFKNKIGLIDEKGEFISEKKEVVLSWPYKDCVLEGGMTKEDQKRDEIFWNEILAPDEISRLFDPKVFTNAKRIDAKGEHKFDGFRTDENGDIKDNLIIKGNNLLALHSLKKRFAGKVKLIYIDPPYNTGNDSFKYNDSFNHSTWLTFMKNRLEVAKDLLREDGSIYVQMDVKEAHYLKIIMDEVFGRDNFRSEIIWDTSIPYVAGNKWLSNNWIYSHSQIFYYAKNKERVAFNKLTFDVRQPSGDISKKPFKDIWTDIKNFSGFLGAKDYKMEFNTRKPEHLIQRILLASSNEGDLIMDFCLGSGTTAAVAHKMRRQYIGVEQLDYGKASAVTRLKDVIRNNDPDGISKEVGWQGGGDFVYLELLKWNQNFVEKIQKARTKEELKKLWETMKKKAFLSYKVDVKTIDEHAKDFEELSIEDQKRFLLECLDKNHLYVNYSEIDDEEYGVSEEDKKLNREFY